MQAELPKAGDVSGASAANWQALETQQNGVTLLVALMLLLMFIGWLVSASAPGFKLDVSDSSVIFAVLGVIELLSAYLCAVRAWRRAAGLPSRARFWSALSSVRILRRLATLLPFIAAIWLFSGTQTEAGFPAAWHDEFGLAPGNLGWPAFMCLVWPYYTLRDAVLSTVAGLADGESGDFVHRMQSCSWYLTFVPAVIVVTNIVLYRAGAQTYWSLVNIICLCALLLPRRIWDGWNRVRTTADKQAV